MLPYTILGIAVFFSLRFTVNGGAETVNASMNRWPSSPGEEDTVDRPSVAQIVSVRTSRIRIRRDIKDSSPGNQSVGQPITALDQSHQSSPTNSIASPTTSTFISNLNEQQQQQQQQPRIPSNSAIASINTTATLTSFESYNSTTTTTMELSGTSAVIDTINFNHSGMESSSSLPPAPTRSTESILLTGENVTVIEDQNHVYYRSSITTGAIDGYWADESVMFGVTEHASLSNNRRSAATIPLSFTFQFYGHEINQVTIATGGFLYMSDFLHQWLTATQYIAPMMANFDTQLGNNSNVHYMDNGSAFIVWWQDVVIDELRPIGPFNFQVALFMDGRIVFSYKKVPISLKDIPSSEHPVKVGISDAYYVDKPTNSNVKRRTIYEYHRIEINMSQIVNDVVVIITPLPTCRLMKTCVECIASSSRLSFNCQWCSSLRRCSDGLDRQRQKWLETGCPNDQVQSVIDCNQSYYGVGESKRWDGDLLYDDFHSNLTSAGGGLLLGPSVAGLVLIVAGVSLLLYLLGWLLYAFSHPNSPSGRWLIEHRPSQLRMRLNHVKFFVQSENGANNYIVSMQQEAEALA